MIKNQVWFERNYSEERKEINLKYEDFQGQLLIEDYPQLERLYLRHIDSIEKITLRNLTKLKECTIWDCGLTDLIIESCSQIKKINVRSNLVTNLEFLKSVEKSREFDLDISFNNLSGDKINSSLELEPFSEFVNLSNLNIGNSWKGKILDRYNRFTGSLMYLENKNKLKGLDISNTDIDRGLEHLPKSLNEIRCSNDFLVCWTRGNGCSQIVQELKSYRASGNCYDLCSWRSEKFINENNGEINRELVTELNNSLDFSIAEKKGQWTDLLTSIENQLTNERSKRIVRKLKDDYRLANSVLELLDDEINQEVMEGLQIISEELKELERTQERTIQQIEVNDRLY